jgi:hypothetical protein
MMANLEEYEKQDALCNSLAAGAELDEAIRIREEINESAKTLISSYLRARDRAYILEQRREAAEAKQREELRKTDHWWVY